MPAGRPSKYKKEYCQQAIDIMNEGASLAEVGREFMVARDTINEWRNVYPEFSAAIRLGLNLSKGWWEKLGREGAAGEREVQPALYNINMKNRFSQLEETENIVWKDKHEIEHSGEVNFGSILNQIYKRNDNEQIQEDE